MLTIVDNDRCTAGVQEVPVPAVRTGHSPSEPSVGDGRHLRPYAPWILVSCCHHRRVQTPHQGLVRLQYDGSWVVRTGRGGLFCVFVRKRRLDRFRHIAHVSRRPCRFPQKCSARIREIRGDTRRFLARRAVSHY